MNKINNRKKFLKSVTAAIVILALIIPNYIVIAGNRQKPSESIKTISICMKNVEGQDYLIEKEITERKFDEINISLIEFLTLANSTLDTNSPGGKNISGIEWDEIENGIIKIIDIIKDVTGDAFPYEATKSFIASLINIFRTPMYIVRQPLLSIGIGVTWIPFYDYETFLGRMFRPVFVRHLIGFSVTARLNPFVLGFPYWYFGFQRVRTFFFGGLLINFADLGIKRLVGPQLIIGYGVFTGFIH